MNSPSRTPWRRVRPLAEAWFAPALVLASALVVLGSSGLRPVPVATAVVLLLVAGALSPLVFPRSPGDAVGRARAAEQGVPLIYWRPGCSYCLRLRLALVARRLDAVWVNVAGDPDASARVRSVNDGNETVPTLFHADVVRTNPAPAWVAERLVS